MRGEKTMKNNFETIQPTQLLNVYKDFYGMLTKYYTYHADTCSIDELHIACRMGTHLEDNIHKILFTVYLIEYWNAWFIDVLDGKYKYIHMINMVWSSWLEYMAK